MYFECKTFLHGLLLVEDKISMADSVETRLPMLDNDLVDLACQISVRYKVLGLDKLKPWDEDLIPKPRLSEGGVGFGKAIIRTTMESVLSRDITRARKHGFSAPDESWLRGKAAEFVKRMLLFSDARIHEYVSPQYTGRIIQEHNYGRRNYRLLMWSLLSFETWLRHLQRKNWSTDD